jgi:hypothetical protein
MSRPTYTENTLRALAPENQLLLTWHAVRERRTRIRSDEGDIARALMTEVKVYKTDRDD